MAKSVLFLLALAIATAIALPISVYAGGATTNAHAPAFTADGRLIPPKTYRQWIFLSSDMDLNYNKKKVMSSKHFFGNVFVNPAAYHAFLKTGTWPDKTQLVLEFRRASGTGSISQHGYFQSGKAVAYEEHLKDKARFKGGWGFFPFSGTGPAKKLPRSAACYACHHAHGAVNSTFVQFYPTLLPIAKKHATLSAGYIKDEARHFAGPQE